MSTTTLRYMYTCWAIATRRNVNKCNLACNKMWLIDESRGGRHGSVCYTLAHVYWRAEHVPGVPTSLYAHCAPLRNCIKLWSMTCHNLCIWLVTYFLSHQWSARMLMHHNSLSLVTRCADWFSLKRVPHVLLYTRYHARMVDTSSSYGSTI